MFPDNLEPLPEKQIERMYLQAQRNETVFRNILLIAVELNADSKNIISNGTLDDIFEKHVRISGYVDVQRINYYALGPALRPDKLEANEAVIYLKSSNLGIGYKYRIKDDNSVEFLQRFGAMML